MDTDNPNPYRTEESRPKLQLSVAAFVDFLGYKEDIEAAFKLGNGQKELERLRTALDNAYQHLEASRDGSLVGKRRLEYKSFTDCLVIGRPITQFHQDSRDAVFAVDDVIQYLGFLQMQLSCMGYFLRGGVAIGELYIDQDMVFGQALMDAYKAEKDLAVNPRVILCESAQEAFRREPRWLELGKAPGLYVDTDERVFIDYLGLCVMIADGDDRAFVEILDDHKAALEKRMRETVHKPHVFSKYQWAANYHNSVCDQFPDEIDESKKLSQDQYVPRPKPWLLRMD